MVFSPVAINILAVKVNAVDHASVVNMGPSQHIDLFVSYKRNQGLGEQNGDKSPILLPLTWVSDADGIDSPAVKNSIV